MPPLSRVSARAVRHRSVPRPPRHTRKANNGTVAELPSSPSRTAALPAARARSGPQPKRSRSTRRADAEAERKRRRFPRSPAPPGPAGPSHGARRDPRCPTGRSQGGAGKVPRAPLSRHLSRRAEPSPKLTEALSRRGERRRCSDRGWGARATVTSRLAAAPRSFPRVLPARHGTARPPARRRLPPARRRAARCRPLGTSRPAGAPLRAPVSAVPAGSPAAGRHPGAAMLEDGTAGPNREQKRGRDREPTRSPGDGVEARPSRAPQRWRRRGALSRLAGCAARLCAPGRGRDPSALTCPGSAPPPAPGAAARRCRRASSAQSAPPPIGAAAILLLPALRGAAPAGSLETGGYWFSGRSIRAERANGRRRRRAAGRSELECCVTMAHAAPRWEGRGRSPGGRAATTRPRAARPPQKRPRAPAPANEARGWTPPIRGATRGGRSWRAAAAALGIGCGREEPRPSRRPPARWRARGLEVPPSPWGGAQLWLL